MFQEVGPLLYCQLRFQEVGPSVDGFSVDVGCWFGQKRRPTSNPNFSESWKKYRFDFIIFLRSVSLDRKSCLFMALINVLPPLKYASNTLD
jgi:hypothetical protein